MKKVLVTGGSGTLGREIVKRLADMHYSVRCLSRSHRSSATAASGTIEWVQGNLETGQGLAEAVAGVDIIVHAASDPLHARQIDSNGTRLLLAQACAAGVSHIVYISIVGIDHIPYAYYQSKLEVEEQIKQNGIPWSILRATQFFSLLDGMLQAVTRLPLLALLPMDLQFQVLDQGEAADRLCEIVAAGPSGRVPDLGGPEVLTTRQLLETWLKWRGRQRLVIPLWLPGQVAASFRRGDNTCPLEPRRGTVTWSEWLQTQYQHQ